MSGRATAAAGMEACRAICRSGIAAATAARQAGMEADSSAAAHNVGLPSPAGGSAMLHADEQPPASGARSGFKGAGVAGSSRNSWSKGLDSAATGSGSSAGGAGSGGAGAGSGHGSGPASGHASGRAGRPSLSSASMHSSSGLSASALQELGPSRSDSGPVHDDELLRGLERALRVLTIVPPAEPESAGSALPSTVLSPRAAADGSAAANLPGSSSGSATPSTLVPACISSASNATQLLAGAARAVAASQSASHSRRSSGHAAVAGGSHGHSSASTRRSSMGPRSSPTAGFDAALASPPPVEVTRVSRGASNFSARSSAGRRGSHGPAAVAPASASSSASASLPASAGGTSPAASRGHSRAASRQSSDNNLTGRSQGADTVSVAAAAAAVHPRSAAQVSVARPLAAPLAAPDAWPRPAGSSLGGSLLLSAAPPSPPLASSDALALDSVSSSAASASAADAAAADARSSAAVLPAPYPGLAGTVPQTYMGAGLGLGLHPLGLVEHLSDDVDNDFPGLHGPAGLRAPLHMSHMSHLHMHMQMPHMTHLPAGLASLDADSGGAGSLGAAGSLDPYGGAGIGGSNASALAARGSPSLHGHPGAHTAAPSAGFSGRAASSAELDLQLDHALLSPVQPPRGTHGLGAAAAAPPSPAASGAAAAAGSQTRLPAGWGKPRSSSAAKPADVDSWFA